MATNTFLGASAVPFNPQTQTFGSSPTNSNNMYSMGNVNLNTGAYTPANNSPVNPIQPPIVPNSQNIQTFNSKQIEIPKSNTVSPSYNTQNLAQIGMQQIATPVSDAAQNISKLMLDVLPNLQGQSSELKRQQELRNVEGLRTNLQNLSNQILQKQAELNQDDIRLAAGLNQIEKQAIPMQFITGQQQSVQRDAQIARALKASEIGVLNASALAAQGNITLAQEEAQRAVEAKYAPFIETYNVLQQQLQAIQPLLNAEEKKVAAQQSIYADLQKQLINYKVDQQKSISSLLMQAQANGIDPQTYSKAVNAFNNGASDIEIAGIIGPYGGKEYLTNKDIIDFGRNQTYNAVGQLTVDNGYTLEDFKKGIAGVESSNNYNAIGPATKSGDKAYGKYQVMGANIPSWTKQALGYSMTPQQFLASPDAQERVFENQSLTNYAKYGNWDDVASVWFSGRPLTGNVSSDGYNTVPQYVAKVRTAMGVPAQPTTFSMVTNPNAELWGKEYQKTGDIGKVPKQFQTSALAWANQNNQNTPAQESLRTVYDLTSELATLPGKQAAVGFGFKKNIVSLIPFVGPEAIAGTSRADFEAKFNQLKDSLAATNLDKLKGAMSDKDIQFLRNIGTSLSLDMSEEAFDKELLKIKNLTQDKLLRNGGNILGGTITDVYYQSIIPQVAGTTTNTSYGYQF